MDTDGGVVGGTRCPSSQELVDSPDRDVLARKAGLQQDKPEVSRTRVAESLVAGESPTAVCVLLINQVVNSVPAGLINRIRLLEGGEDEGRKEWHGRRRA